MLSIDPAELLPILLSDDPAARGASAIALVHRYRREAHGSREADTSTTRGE